MWNSFSNGFGQLIFDKNEFDSEDVRRESRRIYQVWTDNWMSEKGNVFLYFENIEDKLKSNIECFCVLKAIKIGLLIGNVSLHSSFYIFSFNGFPSFRQILNPLILLFIQLNITNTNK